MPNLKPFSLSAVLALAGCAGAPPDTLRGVNGAALAPCPSAPHCVSSVADDPAQRVPPLQLEGDVDAVRQQIVDVVQAMDGAEVVAAKGDYVHATYTSNLLGFVDDVEFVIHNDGRVDIRSSSRIGYYDFGVNRARVEALRQRLQTSG